MKFDAESYNVAPAVDLPIKFFGVEWLYDGPVPVVKTNVGYMDETTILTRIKNIEAGMCGHSRDASVERKVLEALQNAVRT